MAGSDGRLAKVSYFPGVQPPEPASSAPSAPRDDADGWYVDPAAVAIESESAESAESAKSAEPAAPAAAPAAKLARVPVFVETAEYLKPERRSHPKASARYAAAADGAGVDDDGADDAAPESPEELAARAENISMSALTRKGMSSWEMADRLRSRDLDDDTIATEVARLERVGLLDDRELADTLVRTLQDRKGLGRSGITAELRRRHVDADAIEEALAALDGDDEISRATEIAVKRAPQLRSLDNATAKRRLSAFLMRKGYSGSVISAAVSAALEPSGPRFR